MTQDSLLDLYYHMEWADSRTWAAVLSSGPATTDDTLMKTLIHLHSTQHSFLSAWQDEQPVRNKPEDFASPPDIQAWAQGFYNPAREKLAAMDESAMKQPFQVPWAHYFEKRLGRSAAAPTLGETFYQVVSHSMHHRGQVMKRLRELGSEPPVTGYIVWLWLDRPEAEWAPVPDAR